MSLRVRLPNPLAVLDDRALLTRFAHERDQPAFEQLVKRHGGLVFGVCRRAVRDRHLAEDAFPAVFLVLARDPSRAVAATSVGGWLFGVARRVGLAARRHERRRAKREQAHPARASARREGDTRTEFDDLFRVLDEELAALPDDLRAVLVACFLEERTQDEAARELGWSLSTLRRRLDRAKELLRARLARRGVTLAAGLFTVGIASPARGAAPALAAPSPTSTALAAEVLRRGISAKVLAAVATVALAVGGASFGLSREAPHTQNSPLAGAFTAQPDTRPALAPAPRPVETHKWVTVTGRVVFPRDRELPNVRLVPAHMIKDADVWKPFGPLTDAATLIDPGTRGIADVIVFLRPDSDDRKADFPAERVHPNLAKLEPADRTVTAAGPHFAPRILAVRAGDRLVFQNQLTVPINVAYRGAAGVDFNVLLGKGEAHASGPLAATDRVDQFACHIYPWMSGFVWSFDHPYFSVTTANGRFELPNVPVGRWRLVAWHQVTGWSATGRLGQPVTVPGTRATCELAPLTFAADNWPK